MTKTSSIEHSLLRDPENARLFDNTVQSAKELENLLDITREATSVMVDMRLTLKTIIERVVRLIGTTRGAILLYSNGFGTVEAGYHIDPAAPIGIGVKFPTDTPLQHLVREEHKPIQIEDVTISPLLTDLEKRELSENGIKSTLIVPMVVRGKVIGSIGLDETRNNRYFTVREIELCQVIAGQAAITIENARLFE